MVSLLDYSLHLFSTSQLDKSSPSGYEEISSVDIEDYVHVNDANKATALPKSNETTYNYYDYQPFVRIPSLFLTQSDSEELRKMSKRV